MMGSAAAPDALPSGERALARVWQGLRFPARALRTRDGQPLRVVFRGLPNAGPGPDFRHAVILTPTGPVRGDVEVHVLASDFRRHGHHRDPAYDGLVLHVVLRDDTGEDTLLACGRRVPVVALGPHLSGAESTPWQEPCRTAVHRLGADEVGRLLDKMGEMRLRQKAYRLRRSALAVGWEEALYRTLVEACGYGGNEGLFGALAAAVPWQELRRTVASAPEAQAPAVALHLLARGVAAGVGQGRPGRPANRPQRRLAALACLLARLAGPGLLAALLPSVRAGDVRRLLDTLSVRGHGGSIGRSRAVELAVNAVLPLALALAEEARNRDLEAACLSLYRRLPRPGPYGCTRHLDEALSPGRVTVGAQRQQGMLYLYRQYCTRGGCGRCPLS